MVSCCTIKARQNGKTVVVVTRKPKGPIQTKIQDWLKKAGITMLYHKNIHAKIIIVDDMVDTAGTLCAASKVLMQNGAKSVTAYGIHPILSGNAIQSIEDSSLNEVVVTDTIPLTEEARKCSKIRQITLSKMIAETIMRVCQKQSVSAMFAE